MTFRKRLKNSINEDIRYLHNATSEKTNIQYDSFHTTRLALKKIREDKKLKVESLQVQRTVITETLWKTALPKAKDFWFKVQHRLPRNILILTVRYMNNSLAWFSNLARWGVNVSAGCTFCREVQTTKHIVAGCASCVHRYTWQHNSVLLNSANFLQPIVKKLYCDIPSFLSPEIVPGTAARLDLLVVDRMNNLLIQ